MKKPKLKPDQRWRPNRGPWRTIYAMKVDDTEVHWNPLGKKAKRYYGHWCYDKDFWRWIEETNAKLVRRKR